MKKTTKIPVRIAMFIAIIFVASFMIKFCYDRVPIPLNSEKVRIASVLSIERNDTLFISATILYNGKKMKAHVDGNNSLQRTLLAANAVNDLDRLRVHAFCYENKNNEIWIEDAELKTE
jgi:hypothetical protein